ARPLDHARGRALAELALEVVEEERAVDVDPGAARPDGRHRADALVGVEAVRERRRAHDHLVPRSVHAAVARVHGLDADGQALRAPGRSVVCGERGPRHRYAAEDGADGVADPATG